MKRSLLILLALVLAFPSFAGNKTDKTSETPVKDHLQNHFKFYGFIRNYFVFDSRDSKAGTADLFYYLPLDNKWNTTDLENPAREDLNASPNFRFLALTSRVGVDVSGYHIGNVHFGAKVEADFYAGLTSLSSATGFSGNTKISGTAQLRLRQAYATIAWKDLPMSGDNKASVGLKVGQAWHPMAADHPHLFSLEVGAPFGPFSRTPQVTMDANLGDNWILSASAIWQMQYQSTGPDGASAIYMKYGCTPEIYAAVAYRNRNFLVRAGADLVSIKPRNIGVNAENLKVHVKDRKTSLLYYAYAQYSYKKFAVKAKTTYGEGGEHMNLMSGYAKIGENPDGSWNYASMRNSSSWLSLSYGKKWQGVLFLGYVKNLGLAKDAPNGPLKKEDVYFCSNGFSNINQMYRINPQLIYNIGKLNVGIEYQWTSVQYGGYEKVVRLDSSANPVVDDKGNQIIDDCLNARALATDNLHWVGNHRVNLMVKFNF